MKKDKYINTKGIDNYHRFNENQKWFRVIDADSGETLERIKCTANEERNMAEIRKALIKWQKTNRIIGLA